MNTRFHSIAISSILVFAGAAAAYAPQAATTQAMTTQDQAVAKGDDTQTGSQGQVAYSSATARVFHSVTREPLAFMPVYVVEVATPEATSPVRVFITGRDGSAFISPLQTGVYSAFVFHNNNSSNVVTFEVDANTDFHPIIMLFFNPDIDR